MRGSWLSLVVVIVVGTGLLGALTGGATAEQIAVDVTVVDQNGDGVEGAELNASWDGGFTTAQTLTGGGALFQVPEGEDITITMEHPDYVRNKPYKITNASLSENETRLPVEIPVSLAGTATITVEDMDGPVEGASVELRDGVPITTVTTGSNGVAETKRIEQGEYRLIVKNPGYLRESDRLTVDGDVSRSLEIERASVTVQFNVTDNHFDPPQALADARIEIGGDSFTTRDTGLRSTDLEVNREYDVTITKDGYESVTDTLSIEEADRQFNVSIRRTPALIVESSNQRVVVDESTRITVTDEYENPVPGATVSVNDEEVGETDDDGTVEVQIPAEGEQEISVNADGLISSVIIEGIAPSSDEEDRTDSDEETPEEGNGAEEDDGTGEEPEEEDTDDNETADDSGPGFGALVALVGILSVAILVGRR